MDLIALGVPMWFTASGIISEFVFGLVTLLIAFFSYRVYKLTHQRYTGLFTLSFASISAAYFIQAALNLFIILGVNSSDLVGVIAPAIRHNVFPLSVVAVMLHIALLIGGLAVLSYVTLKESNPRVFVLLVLLAIVGLLTTDALILTFYLMSSMFLLFITLQHYSRHKKSGTVGSLLIYFGFALIFLGNFQLAMSFFIGTFYILGHLTTLIGYFLLLASLLRVVRR